MEGERLIPVGEKADIDKLYDTMLEINKTDSKTAWYGQVEDYKFMLREGVTEKEIDSLKKLVNYPIPDDYLRFLRLTNGLWLKPDSYLCDINEVIYTYKVFDSIPKYIMTVGIFFADVHICIDLKSPPDKCMYVMESIGFMNAYSLECSFTKFLSRYITCYGAAFWLWGVNYENKINASILQDPIDDEDVKSEDDYQEAVKEALDKLSKLQEQENIKKS